MIRHVRVITEHNGEVIYKNVEEIYDTRKWLEIIQEEYSKTITTKILKSSILEYAIKEER